MQQSAMQRGTPAVRRNCLGGNQEVTVCYVFKLLAGKTQSMSDCQVRAILLLRHSRQIEILKSTAVLE